MSSYKTLKERMTGYDHTKHATQDDWELVERASRQITGTAARLRRRPWPLFCWAGSIAMDRIIECAAGAEKDRAISFKNDVRFWDINYG